MLFSNIDMGSITIHKPHVHLRMTQKQTSQVAELVNLGQKAKLEFYNLTLQQVEKKNMFFSPRFGCPSKSTGPVACRCAGGLGGLRGSGLGLEGGGADLGRRPGVM